MKLLINFFITAALFFMAGAAFAGALPNLTIKSEGDKSFALYLEEIKSKKIQIRIEDENGFRLFDEEVSETGGSFAKKYNLVNLPAGNYSLEIEDELMVKRQPIEVKNNALVINNDRLKIMYKPVIHVKGQHVNLDFLQLEDAATSIELTDEAGHVLYTEVVPRFGSIQRQFNVAKLENGVYTLSLKVNGRSFKAQVTVKDGLQNKVELLSAQVLDPSASKNAGSMAVWSLQI